MLCIPAGGVGLTGAGTGHEDGGGVTMAGGLHLVGSQTVPTCTQVSYMGGHLLPGT
ncbi:MAG: hypothetical protein ABII16_01300 [Patescibacteria group bacterium]